jgi:hypothetical protein
MDPSALEESACDMLSTFVMGSHGLCAAFLQAQRQGATLSDLKEAMHLAATADAVRQRMDQFEAIRAQPPSLGPLDLNACGNSESLSTYVSQMEGDYSEQVCITPPLSITTCLTTNLDCAVAKCFFVRTL